MTEIIEKENLENIENAGYDKNGAILFYHTETAFPRFSRFFFIFFFEIMIFKILTSRFGFSRFRPQQMQRGYIC